jgi:hypothetical protein
MLNKQRQLIIQLLGSALAAAATLSATGAAFGKDPIEAAKDLASTGQNDPNGLTLMIVSICMLFVFALSLIIATSVLAFKKKPKSRSLSGEAQNPQKQPTAVL